MQNIIKTLKKKSRKTIVLRETMLKIVLKDKNLKSEEKGLNTRKNEKRGKKWKKRDF